MSVELGHQELTRGRKATIGVGVAAGLAGAVAIWSATSVQKDNKGSALAADTQDPARKKYLSDLNAVAAEVTLLHAARGGEEGLQLAKNNCAGRVGILRDTPQVKAEMQAMKEWFTTAESAERLMRIKMKNVDKMRPAITPTPPKLSTLEFRVSFTTEHPQIYGKDHQLYILREYKNNEFALVRPGNPQQVLEHFTKDTATTFVTTLPLAP